MLRIIIDVWSFGVTVWEIYSYGIDPYFELKGTSTSVIDYICIQKKRLNPPGNMPDDLSALLLNCWKDSPSERPTFEEISLALEKYLQPTPTLPPIVQNESTPEIHVNYE